MTTAIAGVSGVALANARTVAGVVHARSLPLRALEIVLTTEIAESGLRNLANDTTNPDGSYVNPRSMELPHDGVGGDHDSVGILQQRPGPGYGWGSTDQCQNVAYATGTFLGRLVGVAGWTTIPPWVVAQDIQVSAYDGNPRKANNFNAVYGGNYAKTWPQGQALADALWVGAAMHITEDDMKPYVLEQTDGDRAFWYGSVLDGFVHCPRPAPGSVGMHQVLASADGVSATPRAKYQGQRITYLINAGKAKR